MAYKQVITKQDLFNLMKQYSASNFTFYIEILLNV